MDKIYPDRLEFVNGSVPALNDTNLNKMSKALDDLDDRVIEVSGDIMTVVPEVREMLEEADALVESARVSASNASASEINAERYAQEAASGSGGNNLDYKDEMLQLKRDEVVLSAVHISGGGGGGTTNYNDLDNKPSINNVELIGNKSATDLGIVTQDNLDATKKSIYGSDFYSGSKSYDVGDTCIKDNKLWKCIVSCSGINPLDDDGTYWERTSLSQINNDLSAKSRAFELVHATYKNASALTVNAGSNVSATLKLDSGSIGDIFLGIEQMVSGNYNCAFSTISSNGQFVSITNASSSSKTLSAGGVTVVARWLKWL